MELKDEFILKSMGSLLVVHIFHEVFKDSLYSQKINEQPNIWTIHRNICYFKKSIHILFFFGSHNYLWLSCQKLQEVKCRTWRVSLIAVYFYNSPDFHGCMSQNYEGISIKLSQTEPQHLQACSRPGVGSKPGKGNVRTHLLGCISCW